MTEEHPGRPAVTGRILAALLVVGLAAGVRADAPLTTADVVRFLKAGISERLILSELKDRGFTDPLDSANENALREAGASETLVVAIRRVAPGPPPLPSSPVTPPKTPRGGDPPLIVMPRAPGREPTFSASTRSVRVPVSVLDYKTGQPIMGLKGEDFKVTEDGKRQAVTLFSGERRPLRLAVALDISGSMTNKIRQVEESLRHFIELLEPQDEILVLTFNAHVHMIQDFTSDREQLRRALDMLEPAGGTALYDAAYDAIQRVAREPAEGKAVVLVTDGVDTVSTTSFDTLRELARRSEVPVFSIGIDIESGAQRNLSAPPRHPGGGIFGPPRGPGRGWPGGPGGGGGGGHGGWPGGPGGGSGGGDGGGGGGRWGGRGMHAAFDAHPLEELADETGGRAEILKGAEHYSPDSEAPGGGKLKGAVETIAMTLRHRYLLGYEPPEGKRGWREIRVDVDVPSATARARRGYYTGG
jgi:VWFA-related protein